ncbi:MAG: CAP domain-containing protein [Bacillales bacterium]|nr:CAP domain-containing protein [Bacillales bacterium]
MRTVLRVFSVLAIILVVGVYLNQYKENDEFLQPQVPDHSLKWKESEQNRSQETHVADKLPKESLAIFIGKSAQQVNSKFGKPVRIDPTQYGYHWWIYQSQNVYIQFGVEQNKVVAVYAIGQGANVQPFKIGQPINDIFRTYSMNPEIMIHTKEGSYRLELSEEDLNLQPLVKIGGIYAQLYLDKFSGTLSSIRFVDKEILLRQKPYELIYQGELPEWPNPTAEQWNSIEKGEEHQIFDITNMIRKQFQLEPLKWDEKTATVAFGHSKEMNDKNYFSHDSPTQGDLAARLKAAGIPYQMAGENIAAHYVDGPAAVQGWLNSEGHRKALLEKHYSHLGVGVYKTYYTQDFIQKEEW